MRKLFCTGLLLACAAFAATAGTRYFMDPLGGSGGSASTNGNETIYRNDKGEITMTAHREKLVTTYRNAGGEVIGTATEKGRVTTYRNAKNEVLYTATQVGLVITYRNAKNEILGTATIQPDKSLVYRDAAGKIVGTQSRR